MASQSTQLWICRSKGSPFSEWYRKAWKTDKERESPLVRASGNCFILILDLKHIDFIKHEAHLFWYMSLLNKVIPKECHQTAFDSQEEKSSVVALESLGWLASALKK